MLNNYKSMGENIVKIDEKWMEKIDESVCPSYKLFTSESYYKSLWECAEHGIAIIDKNFRIIESNPYFAELLGISSTDLFDEDIRNYISIRSFTADTNMMLGLIRGREFSHSANGKLQKTKNKKDTDSLVQIIVTRVPASLINDFQHFIIQIYPLNKSPYQEGGSFNQHWTDVLKYLLTQEWFIKYTVIAIVVLTILLTLSGNLIPLIDKIYH